MTELLFNRNDLSRVLAAQEQAISKEVDALDENQILNSSHSDLCQYFVEKYTVDPVRIDEEGIQADYGDAQVDVSHRFEYAVYDRSRPAFVTGTRIAFHVPFEGDKQLLDCHPSTTTSNPPRATLRGSELVFTYDRTVPDTLKIGDEFRRDLANLKKYLGWVESDVNQFNGTIEEKASQFIFARRDKLLHDRDIVESLGFSLRRSKVPTTYATPEVKRRITPRLPVVSTDPYQPEPTLDMAEYAHILSIISSMVLVIEQSPQAFRGMGEENLRQHFLVQLNGHYEGQATGETFNYEGKTDILIRDKGKNIFIAECKFWTGPSGMSKAIDQLLSYTSWRDTKTALLIFNRDRNMSTVLEKMPGVVKSHSNFKKELLYDSETGFRYVLGHRDDPNREITLTVLAFDVPG